MEPYVARWKECLLEVLRPHVGLPLLLSGGMDSGTLLAGLLELGARPTCFTFTIGGVEHQDFRVAKRMCDRHGLTLHECRMDRDEESLVWGVRQLIPIVGTGKAAIQCSHPVMHMAVAIAAEGFDAAVVGTGGIVEDNRKCMVLLGQPDGEAAARVLRRKNLLDWKESATGAMVRTAARFGVALHQPYADQPLADYALSLDVRTINTPVQKGIAALAFPRFWDGFIRPNSPLQVNSGVREWHDTLLASAHNRRGSKAIVGVYNDLAAEASP